MIQSQKYSVRHTSSAKTMQEGSEKNVLDVPHFSSHRTSYFSVTMR